MEEKINLHIDVVGQQTKDFASREKPLMWWASCGKKNTRDFHMKLISYVVKDEQNLVFVENIVIPIGFGLFFNEISIQILCLVYSGFSLQCN